ncbi:MAG: magnesium transporter [Planctomycetota bacterium]
MTKKKRQLVGQIEELLEINEKSRLADLLGRQRSSDIAEVVELLNNEQRRTIFDVMDKPASAEVLEKVDEATRSELYDLLEDEELRSLISHLSPDDAADVLSELSEKESTELLKSIPAAESAQIKGLLRYSEDSAGGIMDPVLISVRENTTVAETVNKIRQAEIDEDFFTIFVVNSNDKFLGDVRIRLLLTSREDTMIEQLMDTDTICVHVDTDQEEVRNIFSKNDLIVVPVLDGTGRLVGRITADRIIEVAEEEAAEDIYAMAGTDPDELDKMSALHAARVRMTWLLPCLAGTAVTACVLIFFKNFNPYIYAAASAFVPMIAAISGNAGLQTSAIVVSGLATGHLAAQRLSQVFARETRTALLVALSCGIIGAFICTYLPGLFAQPNTATEASEHLRVAIAFGTGMFSAIMVATTLGLLLPFLFRKIGIDPAISSGPLVTTANDSISVTIYMTLTLLLI